MRLSINASSSSTSSGNYSASNAVDNNLNTAWASNGTKGGGVGQWIRLTLPQQSFVSYVALTQRTALCDKISAVTITFSDGTSSNYNLGCPANHSSSSTQQFSINKKTGFLLITANETCAFTKHCNVGWNEITAYGLVTQTGETQLRFLLSFKL